MGFIFESVLTGLFVAWVLSFCGFYNIVEKTIYPKFKNHDLKIEHYYLAFVLLAFVLNGIFGVQQVINLSFK